MQRDPVERGNRGPLPRRPTDRVADTATWILLALGLLAVVLSAAVGVQVHHDGLARARTETLDRTPVPAVVLEQPQVTAAWHRGAHALQPVTVLTRVRYTTPDGVERDGAARLPGHPAVGAQVPVWVDRDGAITAAPATPGLAAQAALVVAGTLLTVALLALAGIWCLVRLGLGRVNAADWEHEWARVEPGWSGRVP